LIALAITMTAALSSACATDPGELGQATLDTPCTPGDADCETARALRPLPVGAAIEARIRAVADGAEGVVLDLVPASDKVVLEEGRLVGTAPGVSGVVAEAPTGTAVDFFHIWVAQADRLSFFREGIEAALDEQIDLFSGFGANQEVGTPSHIQLDIRAVHHSQEMGGDLQEEWTVTSDNETFRLMNEGVPGRRRLLLPLEAATAVVTVNGVGLERSVTLEVFQ